MSSIGGAWFEKLRRGPRTNSSTTRAGPVRSSAGYGPPAGVSFSRFWWYYEAREEQALVGMCNAAIRGPPLLSGGLPAARLAPKCKKSSMSFQLLMSTPSDSTVWSSLGGEV